MVEIYTEAFGFLQCLGLTDYDQGPFGHHGVSLADGDYFFCGCVRSVEYGLVEVPLVWLQSPFHNQGTQSLRVERLLAHEYVHGLEVA